MDWWSGEERSVLIMVYSWIERVFAGMYLEMYLCAEKEIKEGNR